MASGAEEATLQLLAKLDSQVKAGQRKKALRTVDDVLKALPGDKDALHVKVAVLIDLEKFEDALKICEKGSLSTQLWYEKAYCLYRLGKLKQSLETLDSNSGRDEAAFQLRAQLQFRLGNYDAAIKAYEHLFKTQKTVGPEAKTNIAAAYAASNDPQSFEAMAKALAISPQESFETAFNMACIKLETGGLEQAQELLLLGVRSGRESLVEEELTEEQVEQELVPLTLQLALVAARSGRHLSALEQCQEVLNLELRDEGFRAVAVNNCIAQLIITTHPDRLKPVLLDALATSDTLFEKGMGAKMKAAVADRLSAGQQQTVHVNRLLLLLLTGRTAAARDLLQQLLKRYPDAHSLQVVRSLLLVREAKLQEADALLQSLSSHPSIELQLLRAQLASDTSNHDKAAELLSGLSAPDLTGKPAFVTSHAAVLEAAGRSEEALRLVSNVQPARKDGAGSKDGLDPALLPILARLQLKVGDIDSAFKTLRRLQAVDSSAASAGVVGQLAGAALAQDPAAATSLQSHLQALPEMARDAVAILEAAGTKHSAKGEAGQKNGAEGAHKKRRRKKHKRLPRNFDPGDPGPPPDPERWLPKWQRAEFKRKRRSKKDKDKSKTGHQGGAVDESLDRTNTDTPVAAPILPKRARARGKSGRR